MRLVHAFRVLSALVLIQLLAHASPLHAQQPDLAIDLLGGLAIPSGNTARATGSGGSIGAGIQHRISSRLAITTDLRLSRFYDGLSEQEGFGSSTDLRIWRITVGTALRLTSPDSRWLLSARAGIGVAGIRSGPLPPGSQEPQESPTEGLNEDVFALTGGLELSRYLGSRYVPFLRTQFDLYDTKHFLLGLAYLDPENIPRNGPLHAFGVEVGVRLEF